jgi:RimJ/RimL family protein N-acetyltransferase
MAAFPIKNNPAYFELGNETISLQRLTRAHIPLWESFFEEFQQMEYLGMDASKTPKELATYWIERQLERYAGQGYGHLAITLADNTFVGMAGLIPRFIEGQWYIELAYSLLPKYWRKGYAAQACALLLAFGGTQHYGVPFISMIHPENVPSQNLAIKNGMRFMRNAIYEDEEICLYQLP